MKLKPKERTELSEAIETIQSLISDAYPGDEEAALEITASGVNVIGEDGVVLESSCTPQRGIERLEEDQP